MDKNILLVSIPMKDIDEEYDDYDDSDDDSWEPPKKKPKVQKPTKLTLKIQKPKPIHDLATLIDVLDKSTKTISKKNKKGEKTKVLQSLYTPDEKKRVTELVKNLRDLQEMIGMENVKKNIVNQLLLFLQDLNDSDMFLHTVLTGNPGSGKTTLCGILAKIYKSMGLLERNDITIADRPSLVGQWLGETAIKTKKVLDSASGGILLIDEAYSLGNDDGKDSFSKECIDTINQ
jgi:DNA replication protein DnaC